MQFAIPLSKTGEPLFRQVYLGLRDAILFGTFRNGEKLPSTRDLAEQLGISRTSVLPAYDQLISEGYAAGRTGSGTFVASGFPASHGLPAERLAKLRRSRFGTSAENSWRKVIVPWRPAPNRRYDFAYGRSDLGDFPFELWRRILIRRTRSARIADLDYGPAAGNMELREAICSHLRRSRAVSCEPSQVIVVNGAQQALDLIARVLIERGDPVAIENPCYQGARELLRAMGARLIGVDVDGEGIDPEKLPRAARLVFVTPSHQFPTGAILPLARRLALLQWAQREKAVIIEDDYDGEFRYDDRPLESLQGLDRHGRVIYIGTFSRTVFSSLRIGYMVAPKQLAPAFSSAKWLSDRQTASLEQHALAEFISSGTYERYLRRVRRRNADRRAALLGAIEEYIGTRAEVTGDGAGAHVVLWPRKRNPEREIISRAAARGVGVYGVSPYYLAKPRKSGIILGYSRMNEAAIQAGIQLLAEAL